MRAHTNQQGNPGTAEFAGRKAPSRSVVATPGEGINGGPPVLVKINSSPVGGGRVQGGWQRGTLHPNSKNPAPDRPSVSKAMKGWC